MNPRTTLVAFLAATLATAGNAATDGVLGSTSTATFNVGVAILPPPAVNVRVFGLGDFSFSTTQGVPLSPNFQSDRFCVIRDDNDGPIGITINSSDAADTDFLVKTPDGSSSIKLFVALDTTVGTFVDLDEGVESQFIATTVCEDNDADGWRLDVSTWEEAAAVVGNYSNSFLVTVSPK